MQIRDAMSRELLTILINEWSNYPSSYILNILKVYILLSLDVFTKNNEMRTCPEQKIKAKFHLYLSQKSPSLEL